MKKILFLLVLIAILCSCSDEQLVETSGISLAENTKGNLKGHGDKFDVLGHGYNITGGYLSDEAISSVPIVDVYAIDADFVDPTTGILTQEPDISENYTVIGENAEQYSSNLSAKFKVGGTFGIFGASLSLNFGSSEEYSSKYSIGSYYSMHRMQQHTITLGKNQLRKYLTSQFKNDLDNISFKELVEKYGTHLMTDIYTGARLEVFLRAESLSTNKNKNIDAALSATIKLFSTENSITYDESYARQTTNHKFSYRVKGGNTKLLDGKTMTINPLEYQSSIDTKPWVNSITPDKYRFIDIKPGTLIPIYELLEPSAKRNELELFINKYMSDNRIVSNSGSIKTDWSGYIETIILKKTISGNHLTTSVDIPEDYVLIGGGAAILDRGTQGALLTASYPSSDLTRWYGSSKEHLVAQNHTLTVYAVGLKIHGVSKDELKKHIIIQSRKSGSAGHPSTTASLPNGYTIIGGGAMISDVKGDGNYLVKSRPDGNLWVVQGKEHLKSSPACITSYAIGIKKTIQNFGDIEIARDYEFRNTSNGTGYVNTDLYPEWLVTCPGAETDFRGVGRMLTGLIPNFNNIEIYSQDHQEVDSGNTHAYSLRIRKKK